MLKEKTVGFGSTPIEYIQLDDMTYAVWLHTIAVFYHPPSRIYIGGLRLC